MLLDHAFLAFPHHLSGRVAPLLIQVCTATWPPFGDKKYCFPLSFSIFFHSERHHAELGTCSHEAIHTQDLPSEPQSFVVECGLDFVCSSSLDGAGFFLFFLLISRLASQDSVTELVLSDDVYLSL